MKFKKIDFIDFQSKSILTQKTWLAIIMYLCIYFTYSTLTGIGYFFVGIFYGLDNPFNTATIANTDFFTIISLFITGLGILIALVYVRFLESRPLISTGIKKSGFLKQYSLGYLLGIVMIGLPTIALIAVNGNAYINTNVNYGILALYFLGFLVQGASEEIMIRGYLLTTLAKSKNIFWAIFISSFVFAMLHLLNPNMGLLPFINLFLFGIFAAVFFLRTKNIWAICALHSSWNFFQGNVFGIQVSGKALENSVFNIKSACPQILSGGNFGLEGGLFVTILLTVAIFITVFCGNNKLVIKTNLLENA